VSGESAQPCFLTPCETPAAPGRKKKWRATSKPIATTRLKAGGGPAASANRTSIVARLIQHPRKGVGFSHSLRSPIQYSDRHNNRNDGMKQLWGEPYVPPLPPAARSVCFWDLFFIRASKATWVINMRRVIFKNMRDKTKISETKLMLTSRGGVLLYYEKGPGTSEAPKYAPRRDQSPSAPSPGR